MRIKWVYCIHIIWEYRTAEYTDNSNCINPPELFTKKIAYFRDDNAHFLSGIGEKYLGIVWDFEFN